MDSMVPFVFSKAALSLELTVASVIFSTAFISSAFNASCAVETTSINFVAVVFKLLAAFISSFVKLLDCNNTSISCISTSILDVSFDVTTSISY